MNYKFPTDFWWGSASSATQMEGAYNVDGKEYVPTPINGENLNIFVEVVK